MNTQVVQEAAAELLEGLDLTDFGPGPEQQDEPAEVPCGSLLHVAGSNRLQ